MQKSSGVGFVWILGLTKMTKTTLYQLHLEWESFQWPLEVTNLVSQNENYRLPKNASLQIIRDDQYNLIANLVGETSDEKDLEYKIEGKPPKEGEIIKGDQILGYNSAGYIEYKINSFIIRAMNSRFSGNLNKVKTHFEASVSFDSIEEMYTDTIAETFSTIEFHLTGKIDLLFPRSTDRIKKERYSKSRHTIDPEIEEPKHISTNIHGPSRDYFFVETSDFNFIVQKIDSSLLPKWGNGVQIEYRTQFKKIPSKNDREAISEIVGFVLGTHFLKIGESHFDNNNNIISKNANTPWGDNVVSKVSSPSSPPIDFYDYNDWDKIERVLNKVVTKYLELRESLGLSDVLWKYWIANELAIGTNLPILSSALESLAEKYFEVNDLVKSYNQTEKDSYSNLIKSEFDSLSIKLGPYEFSQRVLNALSSPYSIGIGQKLKLFFQSIGILFSNNSIENKALKARNKMTHSTLENSDAERLKYIRLSGAYKSLFNRTFLKILEYDESYVNFYSENYSTTKMSENLEK